MPIFWDRLETLIAAPSSKTEVTLSQFWGYLLLNLIPVELYLFVLACYSNRHALPSESTVQRSALREIARLLPHSHSVPGKLLRKRSALSQRNCRFMHVFRGENWECVAGEPSFSSDHPEACENTASTCSRYLVSFCTLFYANVSEECWAAREESTWASKEDYWWRGLKGIAIF